MDVLLGPDYAGKSTVLTALAAHGWRCVSYDDEFIPPESSLVSDLRTGFLGKALRGLGAGYSADFVLSLLQASVVHLRDQAAAHDDSLVDSYYYKILAKCVLAGLGNDDVFAFWRSFPQPRRVVYLDVDPETAWRRSEWGVRLNPFEHYGPTPTWQGFRDFQLDLRELMLGEARAAEITVVPQPDGVAQAVGAVREILGVADAARAS